MSDELEAEIDGLYRLELSQFVEQRNALAARLKADGDVHSARRVKALVKPSVPAWVVNRLYYDTRAGYDALIEAGEELRAAQHGAGDMTEAVRRRRDAMSGLIEAARELIAAAGKPATDATIRRVSTTLEALAAYGKRAPDPGAGRLHAELDPPGFDALERAPDPVPARHRARSSTAPPPPFTAENELRLAEARATLVRVTRRLDVIRRRGNQAEEQRERAAARLVAARNEVDEAQRRVESAREREQKALTEVARARTDAEKVARETEGCLSEVEDALGVVDALVARARERL